MADVASNEPSKDIFDRVTETGEFNRARDSLINPHRESAKPIDRPIKVIKYDKYGNSLGEENLMLDGAIGLWGKRTKDVLDYAKNSGIDLSGRDLSTDPLAEVVAIPVQETIIGKDGKPIVVERAIGNWIDEIRSIDKQLADSGLTSEQISQKKSAVKQELKIPELAKPKLVGTIGTKP